MYGERKDKSLEINNWNVPFNKAPAATGGQGPKASWNTRFDWKPGMNGGTTYLGKSMPSSLNADNAKKPC